MDQIFTAPSDKLLYLPTHGVLQSRVNLYTEFVHKCARVFFKILIDNKVEFYVFAGSAIGYVRNKRNIPWVDDYDVIIFEDQRKKFDEEIVPILSKNGFKCWLYKGGIMKAEYFAPKIGDQEKFFLCDVFYSKVEGGLVKNIVGQGLYHKRKVPVGWVKPAKWVKFDDIELPFFNKLMDDVKLEYGDVFNSIKIHVDHGKEIIRIDKKWYDAYNDFRGYRTQAIENTKQLIYRKEYSGGCKVVVNRCGDGDVFDVLRGIARENVGGIEINDPGYLQYICSVKFYYPDVKIKLNVTEGTVGEVLQYKIFLEYVDEIFMESDNVKNVLMDKQLYWVDDRC